MPLKVKDLATAPGVAQLARELSSSIDPQAAERLRTAVERVLRKYPNAADVTVQTKPGLNNAFYNFNSNKITTGLTDPSVLLHELGHVQNTQGSPAYRKLLVAARGLMALNGKAAIPVMLGMHTFMGDAARKDAVNTLAGVSAALAGPILLEEASASANAVMNSQNKLETLKRVTPAFGAHAISNLLPALLFSIDRRL